MKSENSGAQEIEFLPSLASMNDTFLRQSVSKQRQSKIRLFSLKLLCIMAQDFNSVDTDFFFLLNRLKKQTSEHFSMLY